MNYITISKEQSTKMEPGTLINNENGTNGGIVTEIIPNGDKAKVYGTWNEPVKGEKWLFSHVKEVIDNGGHRALNGKINYGPQSKRWQGNTSTDQIKEMHLNQDDFTGKNRRIKMNAFILSIEDVVVQPGIIEIQNADPFRSLYLMADDHFELIPTFPIWSKELYLIGSGGRFEIIVKWRSY